MPRPSTVNRLPDDLRREIDRLLKGGKLTLVQITEYVNAAGGTVSKSALHRYSKSLADFSEAAELGVEIARRLGRDLDDGETGARVSEGAALGLETLVVRGMVQMQQGDEVDVEQLADLAAAFKSTAAARKSNIDVEFKIRDRVLKKAVAVASAALKERGITQDTVDVIRARILGIDKTEPV